MSVNFVLDEFNLSRDKDYDIVVSGNLTSISSARSKVVQFLASGGSSRLNVLLKSRAVLNRVEDILETQGVEPLQILNPQQMLSAKLGFAPPPWLSNLAIAQLELLKKGHLDIDEKFFLRDLLKLLNFEIFKIKVFKELIHLIHSKSELFSILIKFPPFKEELIKHFEIELKIEKSATIELVNLLGKNKKVDNTLHLISYNQAIFLLKRIAIDNGVPFSSPPLEVSNSIACLPLINFYSKENDLDKKFSSVLEKITDEIPLGNKKSEIESLIIYPWPKLLDTLEKAIQCYPQLNSEALIRRLIDLEDKNSRRLAQELEEKANLSSLMPVNNKTDIRTIVEWSYKYFDKVKAEFEADSLEYETELAYSFSDWLTSQTARVEQSNFDWRRVSESIEESIAQGHLAVVFMVDALSQIHYKACEEVFGEINHLSFQPSLVFAPLPTITKIGKKSVLTGLLPNKTSSSDLELLINKYGNENLTADNILISQDWKRASSNKLSKDTKLAVVYINELDERLHKTATFNKHATDTRSILNSIKNTMEKWLQDSFTLGKEVSFFVTADHGVTSLNQKVMNTFVGKAGERVVELTEKPEKIPSDFYYLPSYGNSAGYIVPKLRASFDKQCALSHGGLTPEEVLIPFIKLSTATDSKKKNDFDIDSESIDCKIVTDKKWALQITIKINRDITAIHFKAKQPFSGHFNVGAASKGNDLIIPLLLTSKHYQEGRTKVVVSCRYDTKSQQVERELDFDVDIPKPLLKQTESSKSFGEMFDL